MGRPKSPLDTRYGKLTVVTEMPFSRVDVLCDCGTRKVVYRSNLRNGKVSSCGSPNCRGRSSAAPVTPTGPAWIGKHDIRAAYEDHAAGMPAPQIATKHGREGAKAQDVYNLLRAIKAKGGIDNYMAALDGYPITPVAPAPASQRYPAPPPVYKP